MQEFFFHLVGAIEIVAHLVNEQRAFMDNSEVTVRSVCTRLEEKGDEILNALGGLCQQVKGKDVPADRYGESGLIFRAFVYRHLVSHSHMSRLVLRVGAGPPASLLIDPRDGRNPVPVENHSMRPVREELEAMLAAVTRRCGETLVVLGHHGIL